jgi:hypothetical protein
MTYVPLESAPKRREIEAGKITVIASPGYCVFVGPVVEGEHIRVEPDEIDALVEALQVAKRVSRGSRR